MPVGNLSFWILVTPFILIGSAQAIENPFVWHDEHVVKEARLVQWRQLHTSKAVLAHAPIPQGWRAGAFISENILQQLLQSQKGSVVEVPNVKGLGTVRVKLGDVNVDFETESPRISFDITASSEKTGVEARLKAEGLLGFTGTATTDELVPRPQAVFQMIVTKVRPTVNWANFRIGLPEFVQSFVSGGVMRYVGESLRFKVPLTESPTFSLGDPPAEDRPPHKVLEQTMPIKETGGSIELQVRYPNIDVVVPLKFATPLFTREGVWVLASNSVFVPPVVPPPKKLTDADLDVLRKQVQSGIDGLAPVGNDVEVFIHESLFVSEISKIGALPEEQRSGYVVSTKSLGNLMQDKWKDDTFGNGGVYVRGDGDKFATGYARLNKIQAAWIPNSGLQLATVIDAGVTTKLHWHFDPIVTGGFGEDIEIGGNATASTTGTIALQLMSLGPQTAAVAVPSINCTVIPFNLRADTDIKLAVKTGTRLFAEPIPPFPLLTSHPIRIDFPETDAQPQKSGSESDGRLTVQWANKAIDLVLKPTISTTNADGFYVAAVLNAMIPSAESGEAAKVSAAQYRKVLNAALADYAKQMPKPACPDVPGVRIDIGGIEIGPNSELAKYSVDALKVINSVMSETRKVVKTPGKAFKDAPGNVIKAGEKAGDDVKKTIKKIGKALGL